MAGHDLETTVLIFAVSLLIGGFAIHLGSKFALKPRNFSHAVMTALLGAIAWALVDLLFDRIDVPGLLASIVALLVWIWVIRWRYRVGWIRACIIALWAWIAALVTLWILAVLGVGALDAFGVPGT